MNAVHDFARFKAEGRKISVVTAYDAWSARLIARSNVDAILVGDSAAMVMHGHPTTLAATVGLMALHTRAVAHSAVLTSGVLSRRYDRRHHRACSRIAEHCCDFDGKRRRHPLSRRSSRRRSRNVAILSDAHSNIVTPNVSQSFEMIAYRSVRSVHLRPSDVDGRS